MGLLFTGDGLGKQAQGISVPIKPSLKFDKTGIGHDPAKEFTSHWWDDAYKKAADNVTVNSEKVLNMAELWPRPTCPTLILILIYQLI